MRANIRRNELTRVVVVGGGLGGIKMVMGLRKSGFQVVLIDKNNYNQFPPLIYQVASAGLEPSSISFPFRRLFQGMRHFFFRMGEVLSIDEEEKAVRTSFGTVHYHYLVLAGGAVTNFFGNANVEQNAFPMKTVTESIRLRNKLLENFERAETEEKEEARQVLLNVVIVGGGPSGVEIAGALAEMKRNILPRDYPDLDAKKVNIYLLDAGDRLLAAMDRKSSEQAANDLRELGVKIMLNSMVTDYKDREVVLSNGQTIKAETVIWVSGVKASPMGGVPESSIGRGGRILTDRYNKVKGMEHVYAIGDQCLVEGDEDYPNGHPQLAQVAIQQAELLAKNILRMERGEDIKPFAYRNLGTMATIGRKKAVAEIWKARFGGFSAWLLWLVVHLRSILGVKNKTVVFLNWMWNYFNYRQSLRLILKPIIKDKK